ncbi:MAG: flavin reductase family protein [Deltaproteobacteria bacterium]|nr:flavin reductase family protein [Deltaproteobacteria bacterium]
MQIDPQDHSPRLIYQLMTSVIVPRPIAWVSTQSRDGVLNLAPFSFFNGITSKPPLLSIAVSRRRGRRKDTTENASTTGQFVVNVVTDPQLETMVETSADHPPEVDELTAAGLTPVASIKVKPPRVAEAPVQLECVTHQIIEISPGIVDLIIGEVVLFHVADDLTVDDELRVAAAQLRPIGRLGADEYTTLGDIQRVDRPKV